jgi:hypothetical protein
MTPTPALTAPRALRWSRCCSIASAAALALLIAPHAALAQRQQPGDGRGGGGGGGNGTETERGGRGQPAGRGLIAQMTAFKTDVPPHPFSIILVNPTATSVSLSIVCADDGEGFIEFGPATRPDRRTPTRAYKAGEPVLFTLDALPPDAPCAYRWHHRSTKLAPTPGSNSPPRHARPNPHEL